MSTMTMTLNSFDSMHFLDKGAVGRYARHRQNDASALFLFQLHSTAYFVIQLNQH
jgi:hypothetical protein